MKSCALVIGHSKKLQGAYNINYDISEFIFNDNLAKEIEKKNDICGAIGKITRVYRKYSYINLIDKVNSLCPDFIISLHCNAYNKKTSGTEVLYYKSSIKGKMMAEILQKHLIECLKLPNRGIKATREGERGAYLLKYTKAPCVIAEPFFIDNDNDLLTANGLKTELSNVYARAIDEIFSKI